MRQRNNKKQGLNYGTLEARKMLAGAVFVNWVDQNLIVVGNAEDNSVAINLNATMPEQLVQGQDGTRVRFSESFQSNFDPSAAFDLRVFGNDGNDTITIDARSNTARSEFVASLGSGDDTLYVEGGVFDDNATVYGLAGDDSVYFENTRFNGNVAFIAGVGADVFAINGIETQQSTRFVGQSGNDTVLFYDSMIMGNAFIEMGDDADRFETVDTSYGMRFSVRGRIGDDTSMLNSSNHFALVPNLQTFETMTATPNENGGADEAIAQLCEKFIEVGPTLRSFTGNTIQNGLSEVTAAFNADLVSLAIDADSQLVSVADPTPSISAMWDQAVQDAVITTAPGPTIASRAYAMMHTAMYDAWSAFDALATSTTLDDTLQRPAIENTDGNKKVAMSFAAYRVLEDLFADQTATFDGLMHQLGFNPLNRTTDPATPAGVGNRMAEALLEYRHDDGSNQLGDDERGEAGVPYSDIFGYQATNTIGNIVELEDWTPEFVPIDATPGTEDRIQEYLTPHWGGVNTFSLSSGSEFRPVAPEPFLLVDGTVNLADKTITLADESVIAIENSIVGSVINPAFIAQAEEVVQFSAELTDRDKLIAEFWEDGGGTSFPPGTFMTFGQFVSARDNHTVDEDAKMFLALGNAVFDAGVATWEAKLHYDYVRPVRAIRELGELGLIGQYNESLGGFAIDAWSPNGGTQTMLASEFLTYQTPGSDPSPPFAEYTSGHSAFSAAGATVLALFTGSDDFGASVSFAPGSSRFEPGTTPVSEVTLSWDTFTEAADEAGLSRLYGGIHFNDGDINGRTLGDSVGQSAFDRAQDLINGNA